MKTVCTGKILRNGVCDTCYHLSQSSSGDCGRLIDLSLEAPEKKPVICPHSKLNCFDPRCSESFCDVIENFEGEQPAQPVDKYLELQRKAFELYPFEERSAVVDMQRRAFIQGGKFIMSVSPSPERGESDAIAELNQKNLFLEEELEDLKMLYDALKQSKGYSREQLIDACRYGYSYHMHTQFPNEPFDENCRNNMLQYLASLDLPKPLSNEDTRRIKNI